MRTVLAVLIILLFAPNGRVMADSAGQPDDLTVEGDEILPTDSRAVQ